MIDWVELLIRWLHVVAGIAWIGSSFYFIFLDASLVKTSDTPDGVAGDSWQVHGGGFYRMRKFLVAPGEMPAELHWFKYEAYTTWLSGFFLLGLIYYLNAGLYLVDRGVMDMTPAVAIAVSAGSLAAGWLVYHGLCRSPLGDNEKLLAALGYILLVAAAWGYTQVFGGRAAYVHMGALVGSIMVGNVFFVIIPNQKIVVADLIAGRAPDPDLGRRAKQRSLHNNYLTLPVVFVMISGHYPMTYASQWNWLVLAGIFIAGGLVRHFFNMKHAGRGAQYWLWLAAGVVVAGVAALSAREPRPGMSAGAASFAEISAIIETRCTVCHSATPRYEGITTPPLGVVFDTPGDITSQATRIQAQAVASDAMPLGNVTGMTEAERAALAAWIAAGASVK
ncbi:MAG: urate hydroxylase PuuD [Proteobacteria bacterium]|nr:urate hydroxylase PuuD [Pseudomonadota bacterium]